MSPSRSYRYSKRAMDLIGSLTLLVLGAPLLAAVWVLVRLKLGRPVLFRQERAGLDGRAFAILKFRSMSLERDPMGRLLPDDQRLSRAGKFLRQSSLDELPQLWNVVRGEMSLVGPRPLFMDYVPRYSTRQRRRLEVRPGITGLAQIGGRVNLSWEERLELDVSYVESASMGLDLLILLRTLKKVLMREDALEKENFNRPFMGDGASELCVPAKDAREGIGPHSLS